MNLKANWGCTESFKITIIYICYQCSIYDNKCYVFLMYNNFNGK